MYLWRRALGLAALAGSVPLAGFAQELGPGGVQYQFSAAQTVAGESDFGLQSLGSRGAAYGTSELSFGISSETRTQRIAVTLGGAVRLAPAFTQPGAADFAEPFVILTYTREAARSGLSFAASHVREAIAYADAFTGIISRDGTLLPVSLPEDLDGTGTRGITDVTARMDTGRDMPVALEFGISATQTELFETTDPDLAEGYAALADFGATLVFSPDVAGRLRVEASVSEEEDIAETRTETGSLLVGFTYEPSVDFALTAEAGPIWQRERSFGTVEEDTGVTGLVRAIWRGPESELSVELSGTEVGDDRTYAASLDWLRTLSRGLVTARATYDITPADVTDPEETTASLGIGYLHDLSVDAQFGLGIALSSTERDGVAGLDRGFAAAASYRRELTRDLVFRAGYQFRRSDEVVSGVASSHGVFLEVAFDTEGLF